MKRNQRGFTELMLLALIIAVVACGLMYRAMQAMKERAVTAETRLETANEATRTCNKSIDGIETSAYLRGQQNERDRAAAKAKRADLDKRAQSELMTPATVPGDQCKSAQDRVARILRNRSKP